MDEDERIALGKMLAEFRNLRQREVEVFDEYLDYLGQQVAKEGSGTWNPEKITWTREEGSRGPYEKADPQATTDFKLMLADLKAHGGKLTRGSHFYWIFSDNTTAGRKERNF